MNDEIKEILDYLKNDNYFTENPECEVSHYDLFKSLNSVQTDKLLDYITNLQEEIEDLKADYGSKAQVERDILQNKIDKAIEYITKNTEYLDIEKGEVFECEGYRSNRVPIISVSGLLNILEGDKDDN